LVLRQSLRLRQSSLPRGETLVIESRSRVQKSRVILQVDGGGAYEMGRNPFRKTHLDILREAKQNTE